MFKNTTLSSNTHFEWSLVHVYNTKTEIDHIKIISNTVTEVDSSIIAAEESYLQFSGYNEFSNNTVIVAIIALSAHVQENTVMNFISNTFIVAIYIRSTSHLTMVLKTCPIQYISKQVDSSLSKIQALIS